MGMRMIRNDGDDGDDRSCWLKQFRWAAARMRRPSRGPRPPVGPPTPHLLRAASPRGPRPPSGLPPLHLLPAATPWSGPAGVLQGPIVWRCPATGEEVRYFAARVAPSGCEVDAGEPPEDGPPEEEPLVLYLAGLGDAGGEARAPFAKRLKAMMSWGLPPFRFLAPLRPRGRLWILDGDDATYGFLGNLVPGSVDRRRAPPPVECSWRTMLPKLPSPLHHHHHHSSTPWG